MRMQRSIQNELPIPPLPQVVYLVQFLHIFKQVQDGVIKTLRVGVRVIPREDRRRT